MQLVGESYLLNRRNLSNVSAEHISAQVVGMPAKYQQLIEREESKCHSCELFALHVDFAFHILGPFVWLFVCLYVGL